MVTPLRRERMVAHDFTNSSFVISLLQGNARLFRTCIVQVNEVQKKPGFVVAALSVGRSPKGFSWNGKCTMFTHFPDSLKTRWFEKTADVGPISRNGSQVPTMVEGPGGVGKILSQKASSIVLSLCPPRHRHAAPLKSPATKSTS